MRALFGKWQSNSFRRFQSPATSPIVAPPDGTGNQANLDDFRHNITRDGSGNLGEPSRVVEERLAGEYHGSLVSTEASGRIVDQRSGK